MTRRQPQWQRVDERLLELQAPSAERCSFIMALSGDVFRSAQALAALDRLIRNSPFGEAQIYANLFVLVLRDLMRCAEVLVGLGFDLEQATADFDVALPDAKLARDVLSHFDEYRMGCGRLQPEASTPLRIGYQRDGSGIAMSFANPNISLDLRGALDAAIALAQAMLNVIHSGTTVSADREPQ